MSCIPPVVKWVPDCPWDSGRIVYFEGYLWIAMENLAPGLPAPAIDPRWIRLAPIRPQTLAEVVSYPLSKANGGTGESNAAGGTAKTFWARPNSYAGAASYRTIQASDLPESSVTAGSYTAANITVDGYGRVTAAANGEGGGGTSTEITSNGTVSPGRYFVTASRDIVLDGSAAVGSVWEIDLMYGGSAANLGIDAPVGGTLQKDGSVGATAVNTGGESHIIRCTKVSSTLYRVVAR